LYREYRDDRSRTKAILEVDKILAELAQLVADVNAQVYRNVVPAKLTAKEAQSILSGLGVALTEVEGIGIQLQDAGYRDRLKRLSEWYVDYASVDRHFNRTVRWVKVGGACFTIACASVLVPLVHAALPKVPVVGSLTSWAVVAFAASLVGALICVVGEIGSRNRLSKLFRKHEPQTAS
jgi:hypothetical protein